MRIRHVKGSEDYLAKSPLVIQRPEDHKGHFAEEIFGNDRPIWLEVGMGMGAFIRELSIQRPDVDLIGFELNTTVLYKALRRYEAMEGGHADNLRFIRSDARFLSDYFAEDEIDRIYLNFSDPWPKDKNANKRLTSPVFLDIYKAILKDGGHIEFKTDNRGLFDYSLETIPKAGFELSDVCFDLHKDPLLSKGNIMTEYEAKFSQKGNSIYRLTAHKNC